MRRRAAPCVLKAGARCEVCVQNHAFWTFLRADQCITHGSARLVTCTWQVVMVGAPCVVCAVRGVRWRAP